jgi:two-component system, OmpR family, alkaline phosphatase synthesis response regulator PhoP
MPQKILVVDDEPNLRELVKAILDIEGYDVITAEDGPHGIKAIEEQKPDLVLLDMMMPGMTGREVCERVRKNPKTAKIKIIFLTVAKFSELGKGVLEKMDVLDYITKPFDNQDLISRVKKAVG